MTVMGVLGAGQAGSVLAQALLAAGHDVVLANSRDPRTLAPLVGALGPRARAAWATDAAAEAEMAFLLFPYAPGQVLPAAELAGKVVVDNNNYMVWRDGHFPEVDAGEVTVHELRQQLLPGAKLVKAFSHVQFHARHQIRTDVDRLPALMRLARPAGAPDRIALGVSSDHPDAAAAVVRLYDELGFDAVDHSPLRESWRNGPGTPAWFASVDGLDRERLARALRAAVR